MKKPIIDEAVQSGRLGNINFASNTIQVSDFRIRARIFWIGLGNILNFDHVKSKFQKFFHNHVIPIIGSIGSRLEVRKISKTILKVMT